MNNSTAEPAYELKSELARWSLVSKRSQADRRLAWVNSICILFLAIGLLGARTNLPAPKKVAPLEEAAPVIVEPQQATPPPQSQAPAPVAQPRAAAPQLPLVVLNTPAINFSIPTIGRLVSPEALAQTPAAALQAAPQNSGPRAISSTGAGGDRPEPPYPDMARQLNQQGSVVLLMRSDDAGVITSVDIKGTSGSEILDHAAVEFVKRHWLLPPHQAGRLFESKITYLLE